MNKHKFIEFVESPSSIRHKDADILTELARNYPYSSLVRTMLAKARQGTPEAKQSLSTAALYIPDRRVLKDVMEDNLLIARPQITHNTSPTEAEKPSEVIVENQEKLLKLTTAAPEKAQPAAIPSQNEVDDLQENPRKLREQRDHYDNPAKKADNLQPEPAETKATLTDIPIKQLPERLQEILENRQEQPIRDPKRLEQINMIDSFIQNSSNIARKYRSLGEESQAQNDLSSKYQSTPPDLVTENLAQIMVRQGKTEKAIDIYEKLVLKYPQKKAYFATCIEKLKTSL